MFGFYEVNESTEFSHVISLTIVAQFLSHENEPVFGHSIFEFPVFIWLSMKLVQKYMSWLAEFRVAVHRVYFWVIC